MPIREIVVVEDPRLREKAKSIERFTPKLEQLGQDMLETMRAHSGLGLAGPQIGVMQRIFVAEVPLPVAENSEPRHPSAGESFIIVNPVILKTSKTTGEGEEGCLSIPAMRGLVERPAWIEVSAQDVNGHPLKLKVDGLLARIFLHETDHLDGILFVDHITDSSKLWQLLPQTEPQKKEKTGAGPIV